MNLEAHDADDELRRRRISEGFTAGEEWALRAAYDQHAELVYRIALRALGDVGDAEDVTQATFVSAWRGRDTFDPLRGSLPGWLIGIARRRTIDVLRSRARDQRDLTAAAVTGPPPARRRTTSPNAPSTWSSSPTGWRRCPSRSVASSSSPSSTTSRTSRSRPPPASRWARSRATCAVAWPAYDRDWRLPVSPSPEHDPPEQDPMDDDLPHDRAIGGVPAEAWHELAAGELPTHALGAPLDPRLAAHIRGCAECQESLNAYRSLVRLARGGEAGEPAGRGGPAPQVWAAISGQLGLSDAPSAPSAPAVAREPAATSAPAARQAAAAASARPTGRVRRIVTGGLLAAAIVAAGATGWVIGDHQAGPPSSAAQAQLSAQPGTRATAHGRAVMRATADGYQMHLTTTGLPAPAGYYEVWLYDPSAGKMVAIGTLGADAQGSFTVPAGIDTRAYHVVDVSNQRYNGDPTHQTSVLRGALSTS